MHRLLWLTKLSLILALVGCKTTKTKKEVEEYSPETVLVDGGESSQASYSMDGSKILFVSKGRRGHAHAQIYEKDLKSGDEKRITFQNGDTAYPRYSPKGDWIMYSSSTDELKEDPPMLKAKAGTQLLTAEYQAPIELYLHSLGALQIVRLTENLGFDGEARFLNDKSIAWTRVKGQSLSIVTADIGSKQTTLAKGVGKNASQYAQRGTHRAWLEWTEDFSSAQLKIQNGKDTIENVGAKDPKSDVQFSPDGAWLVWSQLNPGTAKYEIWSYEIAKKCVRPLVQAANDRRHAVFSPDMKWLTFTSWRKDRSRIAQLPWSAPTGSCTPDA